jgi:flagellin-like hook-associated protein FlgL
MSDQHQRPQKNHINAWIAGVLSAIVLLAISLLFNMYQAGLSRQLGNLDTLTSDVSDIKSKVSAIEVKIDSLNTRLDDHMRLSTHP